MLREDGRGEQKLHAEVVCPFYVCNGPARSNQSILKEISPGCSLEELMLKMKLQYFGHEEVTHFKDPDSGRD